MTEELAGFLAASRWQDIPASIRREGARAILNIAGCVVAGRQDPGVGILARTFPGEDALLDAAAATAHDYDDTHLRTVIHATPPVAGALFALAREIRDSESIVVALNPLAVERSAPVSKPLDDARLEAKLRELAGPGADAWIRLVGSLESTPTVAIP